ncbi:MAG TPA: M23 family metallopeptidase [Sphingomicrobium sp.]|nr:M23 family metallopeptidase [Sphingomicrobium sp.]
MHRGPEPLGEALRRATAEAAAADARAKQLESAANEAREEADRLRARQLAAAEGIAAAEARITAADAELRLIRSTIASRRQRLEEQQRPLASLLAGLAAMAQRPPLLAVVDSSTVDELVRVQLLIEATMPVIRSRTAALSAELEESRRLERGARQARSRLVRSREELAERRRDFEALESEVLRHAERTGAEALAESDLAIGGGEEAERLAREVSSAGGAARLAAELAELGPAPARPIPAESAATPPPIDYVLPSSAAVREGHAALGSTGIRSRGVRLDTRRGEAIAAPADGIIRFAGPFRSHDGIVIIDHGRGWMSLIINVSPQHQRSDRVRKGDQLGRAMGPVVVELSHNGRRVSPALIAGSSATLSNRRKDG